MNRRLSSSLRRRAIVWLATTACCSTCLVSLARAEVTPLPPGAAAALQPGQQPPPGPVAPVTPTPTTAPAAPRPAAIPASLKTATTLSPTQQATIRQYVKISFDRLMSDNSTAWDSARADLVGGVSSPAAKTPCSAPYLAEYMPAFLSELQKAVASASLAKRVNIAIVVARLAEQINNQGNPVPLTMLYPVIAAEMKDKCDAIALWGVKAATQAMQAAPGAPTQQMLNSIVPCVQAHGLNGAITDEAYTALDNPSLTAAITATMQLYKLRIDAFAKGVPSDPTVDRRAASHLVTQSGMWAQMTQQQHNAAIGLIADHLKAAAEAVVKTDSSPEIISQLKLGLMLEDAKAIYVAAAANAASNPALGDIVLQAQRLMKITDNTPPAECADQANQLAAALKQAFPTSGGAVGANGNAAVAKP